MAYRLALLKEVSIEKSLEYLYRFLKTNSVTERTEENVA